MSGGLEEGLQLGILATAFGLGLRHGVDVDHVAAITDLTSSAPSRRQGFTFALLYATGHAVVVFGLGVAAITLGARLPSGVDATMARVVGVTLVLLAVWVVISLVRHGRSFTLRSRWSLIASMVGSIVDRVPRRNRGTAELVVIEHEHPLPEAGAHGRLSHPVPESPHRHSGSSGATAAEGETTPVELARATRHSHIVTMPADPFTRYGTVTALGVGMLHGIGAETPTQVVVLAAAAGAGGGGAGVVYLVVFLAGLFCSNSLLAIASSAGLLHRERAFPLYVGFSVLIATFSLFVGLTLVLGGGERLPRWLGG